MREGRRVVRRAGRAPSDPSRRGLWRNRGKWTHPPPVACELRGRETTLEGTL